MVICGITEGYACWVGSDFTSVYLMLLLHALQVAINWCIAQGAIPIPGAKSLRNAQDNISVMSWSLSSAEIDELDSAADKAPRGMIQNIFQTN